MGRRAVHPGVEPLAADARADIVAYRKRFLPLFSGATRVFAGGADVEARMRRAGFEGAYRVAPHPVLPSAPRSVEPPPPATRGANEVVLLGALSAIKGSARFERLARRALERRVPLRFVVVGYTDRDASIRELANVSLRGAYAEHDLPELLRAENASVALFLNRWPETYSYTLDHALAAGLWPIVTDIGVPAERVRSSGVGLVVPYAIDDDALLEVLLGACARAKAPFANVEARSDSWRAYAGLER
jgi:glycosyltransferase involved in cell wall biosynthesis